jgi:transcriptional regulator with XRE-family HTH domain
MTDTLSNSLAGALRDSRVAHGLSASALAERSGVSRAMLGKIERGEAQPTAALLGRLSAALGMSLSELVARAEGDHHRLARSGEQLTWTDPDTGYVRRAVSPAPGGPIELVEVMLPPGAKVTYPAEAYTFLHQQVWVLDGHLQLREGDAVHELDAGDCLQLGAPAPCSFQNVSGTPCRYLVALARRRP